MSDDLLKWCDDLHQVRGNVSQLQATLNQILGKAPTGTQYRELLRTYDTNTQNPSPILEKLRASLHSPQVKVAVRLKSLYDKGFLPFLLLLTKINFKSSKADRFVGYLLDYNPPKNDKTFVDKETKAVSSSADSALYPPTLPPLDNLLLLKLVLTDKSLRQPSDFLELEFSDGKHDFNNNHNRKLAMQGLNRLNLCLVEILDETFPNAHEDDIEHLRYRLTTTHVLAKLGFCYNFADSVLHQISKDASTDAKLTIFRNVFLAYIGAMAKVSYSFEETKMWVGKLYQPIISRLQDECKDQQRFKSPGVIAFAELLFLVARVNNYFEEPTKKIRYEFEVLEVDPYVCQLHVGELDLGIGRGSTLPAAKQNAAYETFNSKELRTQLITHIIDNYRVPETLEDKNAAPKEKAAESMSDDDAYSPDIDDYDPEDRKEVGSSVPPPPPPPLAPKPPSNQPRMPLQYGMLPAIPNVRKRGGRS